MHINPIGGKFGGMKQTITQIFFTSLLFAVFLLFASLHNKPNYQSEPIYFYLINCYDDFQNGMVNEFDVEINEIGTVRWKSAYSRSNSDAGVEYFEVPENKLNLSPDTLLKKIVNHYIKRWEGDTSMANYKRMKLNGCPVVDFRVNLVPDNVKCQVLIIYESGIIYILESMTKSKSGKIFNKIVKKIKNKDCPY